MQVCTGGIRQSVSAVELQRLAYFEGQSSWQLAAALYPVCLRLQSLLPLMAGQLKGVKTFNGAGLKAGVGEASKRRAPQL